jgi:hypothetical protein
MSHHGWSLRFGVIVSVYMGKVTENRVNPARLWS